MMSELSQQINKFELKLMAVDGLEQSKAHHTSLN